MTGEFLGDVLKYLRESHGYTREELQKKIEINQTNYIENIETNKSSPGKDTLIKISEIFGVHPDFFTVRTEEIDRAYLQQCFESVTKKIWELMRDSFESEFELREETYTETSLLHFKKLVKKNFFIQKTSTLSESKNGADWQWFVIRDGYWIAFSIQAKKVKLANNELTYASLHYPKDTSKEKKNQCQTLILNAWKENKIPLYFFYNYIPNDHLEK
ncbi:helix-turn-helix transcriptional regulator [Bacillus infantis]|uniref:helix-turn-helix transcriptional regulator n=1 Tax=Bacillus infantis TaxID=324767 RepID=UPI00344D6E11